MNILSYPEAIRGLIAVILSIASFFSVIFGLPAIPHKEPSVDLTNRTLVWSDEFDGPEINWNVHGADWSEDLDGAGTIVRRGSYYNKKLCSIQDGRLHIATRYYKNGLDGNGLAGWYTCGIDTAGIFEKKYGYFECRCILPKGTGLWSAFWIWDGAMSNVDGSGVDGAEIDVFESPFYSAEKGSNSVSSAIHYDGYGADHKSTTVHRTLVTANNPYVDFNTYAVEWNADVYIFYINGVEVGRSNFGGASQIAERLILSVEVDGANGVPADGWSGKSIDENREEPSDFIVDYVRVYE